MLKLTKSLIAVTAGTALLLGGSGTLALWHDETRTSFSSGISAGQLELSTPSAGAWTDEAGNIIDFANYRIAPGDVLRYETALQLTARGENLTGELKLDPASITPVTAGKPSDVALAGQLTKSATYTINGRAGPTFTTTSGTQPIRITMTITWPSSGTTAADNAAMNGSVSLAALRFTATQTHK